MTIPFREARAIVRPEYGETLPRGFEDDEDYNVLPVQPLMDQVVLVNKESGRVHPEVYFEQEQRLSKMTPVEV